MHRNASHLEERIQALSAEQIIEVEDFIDFPRFRIQEREITRAATAATEPAFQSVWSNSEDDIYDAL